MFVSKRNAHMRCCLSRRATFFVYFQIRIRWACALSAGPAFEGVHLSLSCVSLLIFHSRHTSFGKCCASTQADTTVMWNIIESATNNVITRDTTSYLLLYFQILVTHPPLARIAPSRLHPCTIQEYQSMPLAESPWLTSFAISKT